KRVAINRLRKNRTPGTRDLPPPYPNGWYAILESSSLKTGESLYVACLGQHFVVYRTQKNEVFVLDAYCPHLGANLGMGGRVVGDNIECPFHQWSFNGTDGKCANIPNSTCIPSSAKVKKWTSNEVDGLIFVWYHAEDSETPWSLPKSREVESKQIIYHGRNEFYVNCHIQEIPENGADLAHFAAIHNESFISGTSKAKSSFLNIIGGHQWQASWYPSEEKHIAEIDLSHIFKIFHKFDCFKIKVTAKQLGPAYVHLRLHSATFGDFQIFQTITPVEPLLQKVVHRFYGTRLLGPLMKIFICAESVMVSLQIFHICLFLNYIFIYTQFQRDVNVWNHKTYRSNPTLVVEDSSLKRFRKWYSQFYTENSQTFLQARDMSW
ncbi:hypothetical protein KR222_002173, partial [Zaprionus bogoriensis]